MYLRDLPVLAHDWAHYRTLRDAASKNQPVLLEGLSPTAKAFVVAQLQRDLGRPVVVLTYNDEALERWLLDLAEFGEGASETVSLVASADTLLYTEGAPDYARIGRRLTALHALLNGEPRLTIGTVSSLLQRTVSADVLRQRLLKAAKGDTFELDSLQKTLTSLGYERVESVEQVGHWTRRGGIIDIYPVNLDSPVRLDFFGDELESIRAFDADTQRSAGELADCVILPAREMPLSPSLAATSDAVAKLRKMLPLQMAVLRKENLEGRGEQHASTLEERVESDVASIEAGTYFDQAEQYLPLLFADEHCALELLPEQAVIILDEGGQARARWEQSIKETSDIAAARVARGEWIDAAVPTHCEITVLERFVHAHPPLMFSLLSRPVAWAPPADLLAGSVPAMDQYAGKLSALFDSVDSWLGNRIRCIFVSKQPSRVRELLAQHKIATVPESRLHAWNDPDSGRNRDGGAFVIEGSLTQGFKLADAGLMLFADSDLFGAAGKSKVKRPHIKEGMRLTSYLELREGDHVVHIHHGIGAYRGIAKLKGSDGAERDYLLLEYAAGDRVYVPSDQMDRVQRYIGANSDAPTVSRLNSGEWQRATKKAQKQVQEMAADLIKLYAARHAVRRKPYMADTPWQHEMEQSFPYEETPDQLHAINEIKEDLEKERPMDRLICGDVGYGKTEVAMRAAFKVVDGGRQVAVLCPTTILAQQHLNTFRERFAAYPISIEMLSRFVSKSETDRIVKALADGTVDVVIGTHKLLSKSVHFSNLGLLVVDEEQRFGVAHKEKIKEFRKSVDVLTLTATPIPRTLHMSLSGIRDLSLINDPPEGRRPIQTYIREYDDELVREVVLRETDRGGQVYFVSNRVDSIYHTAEHIRKLVPAARVGIAHGQMHEDDLEDIMLAFNNREYDVLVCTTIIESGLDVSNVNSIVVDNADRLGMSQLYQLRGRVGRSDRQGYAYLLYRKNKQLSEIAEKRLGALRDFSELGSGYKVALRDLEIRGAGNLLGREQSGTVADVGFDLYTQLLSQAINELKGQPAEPEFMLPGVNLPLDAHIPPRYIPSEGERILMYKKLTAVRKREDVDDLQAELEDRYGDPPKSVWSLLALLRLRLRCKEIGIGSVNTEHKRVVLRFAGTHLPQDSIRALSRAFLQYEFATDKVSLTISDTPTKTLRMVEEMVEILVNALPDSGREARVGAATDPAAAAPAKLRQQLKDSSHSTAVRR